MTNFNEVFRKDVPYDNFKSHEKIGFHTLLRSYNFRKTTGGCQIDPSPTVLGLNEIISNDKKVFAKFQSFSCFLRKMLLSFVITFGIFKLFTNTQLPR